MLLALVFGAVLVLVGVTARDLERAAATLGVPGILLLVWVGLQAIGALAWIPAVKRLRGDEEAPAP